jgi:hypothetical protein
VKPETTVIELFDSIDRVASRRLAVSGEVRVSKVERLTEVATDEVSQQNSATLVSGVDGVVRLIEPEVRLAAHVSVAGVRRRREHASIH